MASFNDFGDIDPRDLLEAVLDAIPDVIGIQDRHHRMLRYNKAGYEWLKTTPAQSLGKHCFAHIGRDRPCEECATSMALHSGKPERIVKFVPEWGEWYEVQAYPLAIPGRSDPELVIEHLRNITEEKALEERLRQSEKMETIGRLSGGVAHDLNNLLQPILGYAEIVLAGTAADDPKREPLKVILDAAQRSRDIIRKLLAFARRQTLQMEVHEFDGLVADMRDLLRHMLREDIRLEFSCGAPGARVKADRAQFEQVLLNLVINAQDAMPRGGVVTITTSVFRATEARDSLPAGEYASLMVRDTGLGIPAAILPRIFEPFFTTKGPGRGTGLGLATVYGAMQQHGGTVEVSSEPGHGSVFTVFLPLTRDEPDPPRPPGPTLTPAGGRRRIMVVEDDASVRKLVCAFLRNADFESVDFESGAQALAWLDSPDGAAPALLLSDLILADCHGMSLAEEVLRRHPACRLIFMTGYADQAIDPRGLHGVKARLLEKPFGRDALLDAVRAAFAE